MALERLRVLQAAYSLRQFTVPELSSYTGVADRTVRSVLRRDPRFAQTDKEIAGSIGRPRREWAVTDPHGLRQELTEAAATLGADRLDLSAGAQGVVAVTVVEVPSKVGAASVVEKVVNLADVGVIRLLDIVVITKDEDGVVSEADESRSLAMDAFGVESDEARIHHLYGESIDAIKPEDVESAAASVERGGSAAIFLWEDLRPSPLQPVISSIGGVILDEHRVRSVLSERESMSQGPAGRGGEDTASALGGILDLAGHSVAPTASGDDEFASAVALWNTAAVRSERSNQGARQLTPMEAIMWRVGRDATLRMTLGAIVFLDKSPTVSSLTERVAGAIERSPRLRQRPDDSTADGARSYWIDDDNPSAEGHVRALSLAGPGSSRQLLDVVGLLEAIPFDPERSPWDLTLIEGLEGGRAALYLRAHHALTDGVAGLRLLGLLLDGADWPAAAPVGSLQPIPAAAAVASAGEDVAAREWGTNTVTLDAGGTVRRLLTSSGMPRDFSPVETAVRSAQRVLEVASSVSRQMMATGGPLAARLTDRSLLSRFEVFSVDGARSAALALGGSRNDLLVAAAAAGLGRYHENLGTPTSHLRLASPTGLHRTRDIGGDWFAPARLEVPTSVGRAGQQFGIVAERLAQVRREPGLRVASSVAAALGRLPSRLLLPALHAQAESIDFAAGALPGLRGTRAICGATIAAVHPLGPRLGCPLNITAMGNSDRLDVGIALDPSAFSQPDVLVECLHDAFDGYIAATVAPEPAGPG